VPSRLAGAAEVERGCVGRSEAGVRGTCEIQWPRDPRPVIDLLSLRQFATPCVPSFPVRNSDLFHISASYIVQIKMLSPKGHILRSVSSALRALLLVAVALLATAKNDTSTRVMLDGGRYVPMWRGRLDTVYELSYFTPSLVVNKCSPKYVWKVGPPTRTSRHQLTHSLVRQASILFPHRWGDLSILEGRDGPLKQQPVSARLEG
jgi:hypothetical protein